jgi:FMN phosphatase YigB (HAD superfamily)
MTIHGVIFDLGSTLIEFGSDWGDILRDMYTDLIAYLRAHGFRIDFEKFDRRYQEVIDQFYTRGQQDWIEYTAEYTLRYTLAEFGYPEVSDQALKESLAAAMRRWCCGGRSTARIPLDALKARLQVGLISMRAVRPTSNAIDQPGCGHGWTRS